MNKKIIITIKKIIGSSHEECPGIAPEAELYILRVFNSYQGMLFIDFII